MRDQPRALLVLGASGLLGKAVSREATRREGLDLHLSAFQGKIATNPTAQVHRADLRDRAVVERLLKEVRPTAVINCAGIVKSNCEDGIGSALLDTVLPHLVAKCLEDHGGRLLHVSTDCVFSGNRGGYSEDDLPDPVDLYGRLKLAGEVYNQPHLTLRTSFIGLEPPPAKGLLGWFLEQKGEVQGYRRCIWSGLTTVALARILLDLAFRPEVTGLLHIAGEAIDKAALLELAAEVFHKEDAWVHGVDSPVCNRAMRSARSRNLEIRVPSTWTMLEELARNENG